MSKIDNIIPKIYEEMSSDDENQSKEAFDFYLEGNSSERAIINDLCIILCGWSFETILEKCGIQLDENGEPAEE